MITVQYREDTPWFILLANELGNYLGMLATAVASLGLIVLPLPGICWRFRRSPPSQATKSAPVFLQHQSGEYQPSSLTPTQELIKKYSDRAIGAPDYPSPRIGLKEALLLLHLRNTSPEFRDDVKDSDKAHQLLDHMVVAAMLMDLTLQGRITIERGHFGRKMIRVITPLPVGDPDTDALLERLRSSRRTLRYRLERQVRYPGLALLSTFDNRLSKVLRLTWAAHAARASAGSNGLPDLSTP